MGADNLRSFHRWQKWRKIAELVPIVVVDRLGPSLYAAASPAGNVLAHVRIPEHAAASLPDRKAPVWAFLHGLKSPLVVHRTARLAPATGNFRPPRVAQIQQIQKSKTSSKKNVETRPEAQITGKDPQAAG